jgi:hypothetical protein
MNTEAIEDIGTNWEFVTFTTGFYVTRIIRSREKNMVGTYNYRVQRKYPFFGWTHITTFSADRNVHG